MHRITVYIIKIVLLKFKITVFEIKTSLDGFISRLDTSEQIYRKLKNRPKEMTQHRKKELERQMKSSQETEKIE